MTKHFFVDHVSKNFGDVKVLDKITMEVQQGEFIVLLGSSGCGKSTLLRLIAGLETVDSGRISINNRDITDLESSERDLAMVFQSYALYPHMTIRDNISYPLKIRKRPSAEISEEVKKTAAKLGLEPLLDRLPKELSGGQRQRVALARAMVRRPLAFLMDEPLSNLDASLRVQMRAELKHLHKELGTTTLYVTHDQTEAMTLARRIAVMEKGKIAQFDTPQNIYNNPAGIFVATFVGSPSMNLAEGSWSENFFKSGEMTFSLPLESLPDLSGNLSRFTLGFRPEDIDVSLEKRRGYCPAKVFVTEELGNENYLILSVGDRRITARVKADMAAAEDSVVWILPKSNKLHFFDSVSGQTLAAGEKKNKATLSSSSLANQPSLS